MNTGLSISSLAPGFSWAGVDHFFQGQHGLIPRRVSHRLYEEMTEGERSVAAMCAGIEAICADPRAKSLEVTFRILRNDGFPAAWAVFRGLRKVHPTRVVPVGTDELLRLRWETQPSHEPLRLLFPTHAEAEVVSIATDPAQMDGGISHHTQFRAGCKLWLVHGDSITQGANVTSPDFTWIEQVARFLPLNPWNFGFGGNARAQESIAHEIARRDDWDVLSIHIGANSIGVTVPGVYRQAYGTFLDIIRSAHRKKPVACITPILHFSDLPGGDGAAEDIRKAIREAISQRTPFDPNLHLIEGKSLLNHRDSFLSDGVHPSDHGAAEIARNLGIQLATVF